MKIKGTKRKVKTSDKFRFELDNIITKQVIACQRSRILITLSGMTSLTCLLFKNDLDHSGSYLELKR